MSLKKQRKLFVIKKCGTI